MKESSLHLYFLGEAARVKIAIVKIKMIIAIIIFLQSLATIAGIKAMLSHHLISVLCSFVIITLGAILISGKLLPRIKLLKKDEIEFTKNSRSIFSGECENCGKYKVILYPHDGGLCKSCLKGKYNLTQAKDGIVETFHPALEELYSQ